MKRTTYAYDANGRLTETSRGDVSCETRTYDAAGQLLTITDTVADGTIINDLSYTYNADGTVKEIKGSRSESTGHGLLNTAVMTYDEAGRLSGYNEQEVLFDDCGNMIYGPVNGEMQVLEYDCRNRLVKAGDTEYTYDCENNRIAMEDSETVTEYTVETVSSEFSRVLYETLTHKAEETVVVTVYTYGDGLVSQNSGEEVLYYHYNHLGSTLALTDEEGSLVSEYTYGTYGELLSGDTTKTAYLYKGKYGVSTDCNGLYYMRARYYSVDIKRFINRDVVRGNLVNSQSLNRYCYVQGNPVSYTDPFGLSPYKEISQKVHSALDWLGFTPVGVVADGANALMYLLEGDTLNATLSGVATVPVIGDAAAAAKVADKVHDAAKFGDAVDTFLDDAVEMAAKNGTDVIDNVVKGGSNYGYYKDATGKWHRPNGDFASNAEVGITSTVKTSTGSHGNSLSDPRTDYGYALVDKDTNEILKFGETLYPDTRYSNNYLEQNNAIMKVLESGSKEYIHHWQYDMNKYFEYMYGEFPRLINSKGW